MFKLFIIIILFLSAKLFAQRRQVPPPPIPMKNGSNLKPNYMPVSLANRLKKFPFKNAATIEIISFNLEADAETMDLVLATTDPILCISIKVSTLFHSKVSSTIRTFYFCELCICL
ncbi:hypothetical protein [Pedobacter jejuensis]|uniref:Uncharacterized protein n=1 Tax=Pedobacter jejuensis TaxID=1268550 RepID=A0A3N0BPH9_9SPHI|nr:hypothetical protein [Pedobacter jejuensis]RNL50709.1 hypothetical protein D7004_17605 [Pedobacter jejuensis]